MLQINFREAMEMRKRLSPDVVHQTRGGTSKKNTYFLVEGKRNLNALNKYRESIKKKD